MLDTERRESLRFVELMTNTGDMTFTDALRNGAIGSNLTLQGTASGRLDSPSRLPPGRRRLRLRVPRHRLEREQPGPRLASFEVIGFDRIVVDFAPTRATDNVGGTIADSIDFAVETTGGSSGAAASGSAVSSTR